MVRSCIARTSMLCSSLHMQKKCISGRARIVRMQSVHMGLSEQSQPRPERRHGQQDDCTSSCGLQPSSHRCASARVPQLIPQSRALAADRTNGQSIRWGHVGREQAPPSAHGVASGTAIASHATIAKRLLWMLRSTRSC